MDAIERRPRPAPPADPARPRLLSPALVVAVALALLAAALALAYLLLGDRAPAAAEPPPVAAPPAVAPEPVELRCIGGTLIRKQGSSYSSAGSCIAAADVETEAKTDAAAP